MTVMQTYQAIQNEVLRRIHEKIWLPGEMIPGEQQLADDFSCSRATVNRALRELAQQGILDRKRRSGTRVCVHPARHALLKIPLIRREIEQSGSEYSYVLLEQGLKKLPPHLSVRLQLPLTGEMLYLRALHLADGIPYSYETRFINQHRLPSIQDANFSTISANEWLVKHAPFTRAEFTFHAVNATDEQSELLACIPQSALLAAERVTWLNDDPITWAKFYYHPDYQMNSEI